MRAQHFGHTQNLAIQEVKGSVKSGVGCNISAALQLLVDVTWRSVWKHSSRCTGAPACLTLLDSSTVPITALRTCLLCTHVTKDTRSPIITHACCRACGTGASCRSTLKLGAECLRTTIAQRQEQTLCAGRKRFISASPACKFSDAAHFPPRHPLRLCCPRLPDQCSKYTSCHNALRFLSSASGVRLYCSRLVR